MYGAYVVYLVAACHLLNQQFNVKNDSLDVASDQSSVLGLSKI